MVCKICLSGEAKFFFHSINKHGRHKQSNEKFAVFRCSKCGVLFLKEVKVNSVYYRKYYGKDYYKNTVRNDLLNKILAFFSFVSVKKKEKFILKYFNNLHKISILDVGCGDGKFLERLDQKKFDKYGLELNKEAIKICQKKEIFIYGGKLVDLNFKNKKFDVISLWHSLEHIEDPIGVLRKIKRILSKKGILVIQTPNVDSFGFKFGKENWFHLDSPRHLFIYSKKAIGELCERTDFEIFKIKNEFYDYPLDLFWSIRSSPIKYVFYLLYPIIKFLSKEHFTYIIKHKSNCLRQSYVRI